MDMIDFPRCCTAKIVHDFGGTDAGPGGLPQSVKSLVRDLNHYCRVAKNNGNAFVVLTINNEQTNVIEAIKEMGGWGNSRWGSKSRHPETRVRIYYRRLDNFE